MSHSGPAFYDVEDVFRYYTLRRAQPGNANDTLEKPIFDEVVGAVSGLRILDIGCGDARFGRDVLAQGCASYLGIDGSQRMTEAAHQILAGTTGQVIHAKMETWDYPRQAFDLIVSRMALHYTADLDSLFAKVYGALTVGGRFIFSVEHPVITSSDQARPDGTGKRQGWIVDDYFATGPRVVQWMGGEVIKVHHTVEDYFGALQQAGFLVTALREARPRPELFPDPREYARRQRIPLMLLLAGQRPNH